VGSHATPIVVNPGRSNLHLGEQSLWEKLEKGDSQENQKQIAPLLKKPKRPGTRRDERKRKKVKYKSITRSPIEVTTKKSLLGEMAGARRRGESQPSGNKGGRRIILLSGG